MSRGRVLAAFAMLVGVLVPAAPPSSMATLADVEAVDSAVTTAASFDVDPPSVGQSVVVASGSHVGGFVRAGGTYHVYANVSDGGPISSGVAQVAADLSMLTSTAATASLVAGSYSVGGIAYGFRSAALVADSMVAAGTYSYAVLATDAAGNASVRSDFSVTVDETAPSATDVQTTNAGTAGAPELGDRITFSFSEPIDPASLLEGWDGGATGVVVRITDGALGDDQLTVRDATNAALLPLGTVNLGGQAYVLTTRDFGSSGTASTMELIGSTIVVTLGTTSGMTGAQLVGTAMSWAPSSAATDAAGNPCSMTPVAESGSLPDLDF